jgi:hypothetical protein
VLVVRVAVAAGTTLVVEVLDELVLIWVVVAGAVWA